MGQFVPKSSRGFLEGYDSMTFQVFFFDTYIGFFLQALPITLMVGAIYGFVRFRLDKDSHINKKLFSCILVCYFTGLVCLVLGLDLMRIFWFDLFYHMDSGITIDWFGGEFDLVPNFFNNISGETIGNFLMFLPFGILYPLSQKELAWKKSIVTGLLVVIVLEVLQPVFGRAFDMNDIILNSLGIVVSTSILVGVKKAIKK